MSLNLDLVNHHQLLNSLNSQRQKKEHRLLSVHVGKEVFFVHQNVVEALSPSARELIDTHDEWTIAKMVIKIDSSLMSPNTVEQILDYFYTRNVTLSENNVFEMMRGAHLFHLANLINHCQDFLTKNMHKDTCLRTLTLAADFKMMDLEKVAYRCARDEFYSIAPRSDNVTLISKCLLECPLNILYKLLKDDDLCVRNEDQVLLSVISWVEHKPQDRIAYIDKLFSCVLIDGITNKTRLALSKKEYLMKSYPSTMFKIETVMKGQQDVNLENEEYLKLPVSLRYLAFQRHGAKVETVLVLGGQKADNTFNNNVYAYLMEQDCWVTLTEMPYQASSLCATCCGDNVYICGGTTEKSYALKYAWKYNITTNQWTRLPDLPEGVAFHTLVTCNASLYIIGGCYAAGLQTSKLYSFDIHKEKWIPAGNMSKAMCGLNVITRDHRTLYIVTGRCMDKGTLCRVGLVEMFDVASGKVRSSVKFPIRFKHRPFVWFQREDVLGIHNHKQNMELDLSSMSVRLISKTVPLMPQNVELNDYQAICDFGKNKVFVCGGIGKSSKYHNNTFFINPHAFLYNKETNEWKMLSSPPVALDCAACCMVQMPVRNIFDKEKKSSIK